MTKRNCFGCRHANVTLEAKYWNHCNYANVFYQTTVYCAKKGVNIKYPQELCADREVLAPLKLDSF